MHWGAYDASIKVCKANWFCLKMQDYFSYLSGSQSHKTRIARVKKSIFEVRKGVGVSQTATTKNKSVECMYGVVFLIHMCVYIHIHIHTHTNVYVYILPFLFYKLGETILGYFLHRPT